jgi:signal peptidase I
MTGTMTALRWTRRTLDTILVAAVLVVTLTAGITLLAPVLGGRVLVIGGRSMEPSIHLGALVLAVPASDATYAVGDVVTVGRGGTTPYTHRITRLAQVDGVAYAETKGDANAGPDPALVPRAAIVGRVVIAVPALGYLSAVLGSPLGLAGFLATGAALLLLVWLLEDLEHARRERGPAPAPRARVVGGPRATTALARRHFETADVPRSRVREGSPARDPNTPVVLESHRRDPRRRGAPRSAPTAASRPA